MILKKVILRTNDAFPVLKKGDHISVNNVSPDSVNINDILLIKKEVYLPRRVIYKSSDYIVLRNDKTLKVTNYPVGKSSKLLKVSSSEHIYLIQNLLYSEELKKINKILAHNKIDFLFLKGLPLSLFIMNKPPRRLYADCDLLVNKIDLSRFENIIQNLGYTKQNLERLNIKNIYKDKITEITYIKKVNNFPIVLDIHAEAVFMMNEIGTLNNLYPQKNIDIITNNFLKDKIFVKVLNQRFPVLSEINIIFYLALHIFHHNFRGYNNYNFFDLTFRKINPDLKDLLQLIKKTRTENFLLPVFSLYKKYYNEKLPENFLLKLKARHNFKIRINIFAEQSRVSAGINRFYLLFKLSPLPLNQRLHTLLTPAVIFSFILVLIQVLIDLLRTKKLSDQ